MRTQINKLKRGRSTKAERRFAERLKSGRILFRTKVKVKGREVDFIIGQYAIDIDGHGQAKGKNEMLAKEGYIPIHIDNNFVDKISLHFLY